MNFTGTNPRAYHRYGVAKAAAVGRSPALGVTLMEALMVLGVLAVLLGAVMVFLSQSYSRQKANDYVQEVGEIIRVTDALYGESFYDKQALYINNVLATSGQMAGRYVKNGVLVDPRGVPLTVAINHHVGSMGMNVSFFDVDYQTCVRLGTMTWGGTSFHDLHINMATLPDGMTGGVLNDFSLNKFHQNLQQFVMSNCKLSNSIEVIYWYL